MVGTVTGLRDCCSGGKANNSHHKVCLYISVLVDTEQLSRQFSVIIDATTADQDRQNVPLISLSHNIYELYTCES
jgi:hypothetical protein